MVCFATDESRIDVYYSRQLQVGCTAMLMHACAYSMKKSGPATDQHALVVPNMPLPATSFAANQPLLLIVFSVVLIDCLAAIRLAR
jgi:hypothetical protein